MFGQPAPELRLRAKKAKSFLVHFHGGRPLRTTRLFAEYQGRMSPGLLAGSADGAEEGNACAFDPSVKRRVMKRWPSPIRSISSADASTVCSTRISRSESSFGIFVTTCAPRRQIRLAYAIESGSIT